MVLWCIIVFSNEIQAPAKTPELAPRNPQLAPRNPEYDFHVISITWVFQIIYICADKCSKLHAFRSQKKSKWPIWSERNTFWPMLNWRLRKWNVCRVMITCSRRLAKTGCYIFQVMGSNEVAEHQQPKFYPLVNVYKKLWKILENHHAINV